MGKVVLHLDKAKGTDSAMSSHIERTIAPKNADASKTHLNMEFIEFPEGVNNRHQAIQYRLDNAGLARKIGANQVRAIRILLSDSQEEMKTIEAEGKLNDWCNDNLDWLYKTYGKENIVSAVLHMDETTPHIHATLVPIVTGERRKAKQETDTKKKYKKKNSQNTRLCADDLMARDKLKEYQNSYAQAMAKYGLERGIEGSEAKHITTSQYYRDLFAQTEVMQDNLDELEVQKEQASKELSSIKSNIKTEKLKSTAVDVGSNIVEGIGSLIGTSKVKKQQQEIEQLKNENETVKAEFIKEIKSLKEHISKQEKEHRSITSKLKQELKKIYDVFPNIKELLRIENLCKFLGFSEAMTKTILEMKPVVFKGSLYSAEFKRHFETEKSVAEIKSSKNNPDELLLTIDGVGTTSWFRQKHNEFLKAIGINAKLNNNRGKNL